MKLTFVALLLLPVIGNAEPKYFFLRDTGSMKVTKGGQAVELIPVAFVDVKVGDVVKYHHRRAGFVCHRVIWRDGMRLWTKGDNNRMPDDEYVTVKSYIGVAKL